MSQRALRARGPISISRQAPGGLLHHAENINLFTHVAWWSLARSTDFTHHWKLSARRLSAFTRVSAAHETFCITQLRRLGSRLCDVFLIFSRVCGYFSTISDDRRRDNFTRAPCHVFPSTIKPSTFDGLARENLEDHQHPPSYLMHHHATTFYEAPCTSSHRGYWPDLDASLSESCLLGHRPKGSWGLLLVHPHPTCPRGSMYVGCSLLTEDTISSGR